MASFFFPNSATLTLSLPATFATRASFQPPQLPNFSTFRFTGGNTFRRKVRGLTVVTRAGPNRNSYIFAFALPLSLLAITIFTSIRIADKLDSDFLEEIAINEAIREAEEDSDDDGDINISLQEEPAISRTRNRPKREA
ncbi:high chlorophyll fluorescence [Quillaja saponaria]|uniref:High chlorophyll fluorescence n=1 Tax=Quillaja saponaria TaxID=32244 RepID=A0AAD7L0C5_QUISA|nr:high chlorophyll fluorescence [Quillaja saponaria]